MKKITGIILGLILILITLIILFPYLYKGKINRYIKTEINNKLNAKVDYGEVNISLFKDFPNLHVSVKDISIDGKAPFDTVRLASIPEFNMSLNFKKLFTDENLEITKIGMKNPIFIVMVLEDGTANYDIMKKKEENKKEVDNSFDLKIKEFNTENLQLLYNDQSMGLKMNIKDLNQTGKGVFKQDKYIYETNATAQSVDVIYDSIHYLNKVKTDVNGKIIITNDFETYEMKDVKAKLNDLGLTSNMFFDLQGEDIKMNISYQSTENNLKKFLSLIPPVYLPDLSDIQTKGKAILNGFVKGTYNENNYPAFGVNFNVNNGQIKYTDLPESLNNIQVAAKVDFPGGKNLDQTKIDLSKIFFKIADNPIKGYLKVSNPTSDPLINTAFDGKIDFSKLQKVLKLEKSGIKKLNGKLNADFKLLTRMSFVEKEKYNNIKASGNFDLKDMVMKTDSLPYAIQIPQAQFTITPAYLDVKKFKSTVGKSNFNVSGKIENYLAYALKKNKILKADFSLNSQQIDLNEFMNEKEENSSSNDTLNAIKIPKNVDFHFKGIADKVIYKDMILNNVKGDIVVKDQKAVLNTVLSKAFGGEMSLNGSYDTSKDTPVSKLKMEMKKVSIPEATTKLSTFNYYAPALKKVQGQLFSLLEMNMQLDEHMNPVFSTLDLNGLLETENVKIIGIEVLTKIADLLKMNELKKPKVDKVKAHFIIEDGNLKIKPFDFKLNGIKSAFQGSVSLERKIDFILGMDIPKEKLGNKANQIMENLIGNLSKYGVEKGIFPEIIKIKFKITGDYKHPVVKPVFAGAEGKSMKDVVSEAVTTKVEETIDKAKEKALMEAQKQGEKLVSEAQAQGNKLIEEAHSLADKIRNEAQKQADALIKKAGNNPFQKLVAQKAAKKIIEKADEKANLIEFEAKKKADLLVNTAQNKANKLVEQVKSTDN